MPGFGQTSADNQQGSRVISYASVQEGNDKFMSISFLPPYKDKKSHEELRWEDYQLGDKGSQIKMPGFGQTGADNQQGSRVMSYASIQEGTDKFMSISLLPPCKDKKSHEELKREDYQLGDKGSQTKLPGFGQTGIDNQQGSRVLSYASVQEGTDKFMSISFLPPYKDKKSHEELRWEDYLLGDKGGAQLQTQAIPFGHPATTPNSCGTTTTSTLFGQPTSASPCGSTNNSQSAANTTAFGSTTTNNPFGRPVGANASQFGSANTSNAFSQPAANSCAFGSTNTSNAIGQPAANTSAFGSTNTSNASFGQPAAISSAFGSADTSNAFGQTAASSAFGSANISNAFFGQPVAMSSAFGSPNASNAFGQSAANSSHFGCPNTSNALGQPVANSNPFGSTNTVNAFSQLATNPSQFGSANESCQFNQPAANSSSFGPTHSSSSFGQTATNANPNPFGLTGTASQSSQLTSGAISFSFGQPATASSLFGSSNTSSSFGQPTSNLFGTTNTASSSFGQSSAPSPSFNSQTAAFGFGSSSTPSFGSNSAPSTFCGTTPSLFGSAPSVAGSNASSGSTLAFTTNSQSSSIFAESTGQNLFNSSSSSLFSTTNNTGFGQATTPSTSAPVQQSALAQTSNAFAFSNSGQTHSGNAPQSTACIMQLSTMPNFSTVSSIQQEIAAIPVPLFDGEQMDKAPFRNTDVMSDKAPFRKTDVTSTPRANPRSIINPTERRHSGSNVKNQPVSNNIHCNGNGSQTENGHVKRVSGTENGLAKQLDVNESEIEALLPKLRTADYYTEPQIEELVERVLEEPEYCSHVKDFVVGRRGFGYIKFYGETDVRGLDLESIIEFNNREVILYKNGSNKPGIGQGMNKPAEVSLLNIKCVGRNSGKAYTMGPNVEQLTQMLKRKAEEQNVEFLSYDAAVGEWKFRVKHF